MEDFFGRFHPVLVHLPIGFIIIGLFLELYGYFRKNNNAFDSAIKIVLILSVLSGIAASSTGWMLSEANPYPPGALTTHKWLAISVIFLSLGWLLVKLKIKKPQFHVASAALVALIVSLTGHFGGVLTHGEDYLVEYSPDWVRNLVNFGGEEGELAMPADSVLVYPHLIRPVLAKKCASCHNGEKASGGFDVTGLDDLFEEAETGMPVTPGNAFRSEVYQRVTLPVHSKKFMPPVGDPLTYTELSILRYWIENGADSALRFNQEVMDPELVTLVNRDFGLDYTPKPYYEKLTMDSLPTGILDEIAATGFVLRLLGEDKAFVEVDFKGDTLTTADMELLENIAEHVLYLKISDSFIDEAVQLNGFRYLNKLDLSGSQVWENSLSGFSELEYLEVLNLHGSLILMSAVEKALQARAMKNVYVWQSSLDSEEIESLQEAFPSVNFESGFTFRKASE